MCSAQHVSGGACAIPLTFGKWRNLLTIHEAASDQRVPRARHSKARGKLVELVLESLNDDKAQDIVCIDLVGKTSIADYMVIANGRSHRHVSAIADHLLKTLKQEGFGKCRVEGMPHCDWVLLDAGDVIVHIFRPEVREFYNLEKMWGTHVPREEAML